MVPKPIVANSSFVTYKYGKNKLGVEVRKNKKCKKKGKHIDFQTITGCPINIKTRSTLIFSFRISATAKVKPLLKSLDPNLQGATLILIFFQKLDHFLFLTKQNVNFFWRHAPTPFFSKCPKILFPQIHVPGTWNFVFSSNSCTRVDENKILGHFEKKWGGMAPTIFHFCFVFCRY